MVSVEVSTANSAGVITLDTLSMSDTFPSAQYVGILTSMLLFSLSAPAVVFSNSRDIASAVCYLMI